jgi:hypothetical protein
MKLWDEARAATIWFLDWVVDVRILDHRFTWYCAWLTDHPWWQYVEPSKLGARLRKYEFGRDVGSK